ncbi:hypothetical protein GCM10011583_12060 [Streptomyces camponoticapitis]|uniref:Uncharacterized protein n=1 Tax=Streptomyces camponoticapitis TaxID=1616125 RepID=A0ABQ2E297_9ACTN|nr:hypothetical protein [Streptomyces camponoticapitis]GGJ82090.1 hypothetical protein GCM10011583_12060 [Streptomyces camponoticapitis]
MAFPEQALDLRAEVQIGGLWTDITSRLRTSDPLVASYGMSAEGTSVDPSTCTLKVDNSDGALSARNPLSPWHGALGRNIPLRVTVPSGESYLALTGTSSDIASAPDHNDLDIVGDLDLRVEITGDLYNQAVTQNLIGKWDDGPNPSFLLQISTDSQLRLRWSDASAAFRSYTVTLPAALPRRVALRAHLDVDNGDDGFIARMYWAPSLAGPWTRFDSDIPGTGTTSIYSSTVPLSIAPTSQVSSTPGVPLAGRVHAAEVRNSSGVVVASPDFAAQVPGTATFTDSSGKTWTLAGAAEITDREYLFHGEMSKSPPRWVPSGKQVWVSAEAAGILRRLGQGRKALDSTLRRRIPSAPGLVAYWPMEEMTGATQAYSPVAGVAPLKITGFDFATEDTLGGSSPLPKLKNPASLSGAVPRAATNGWQVEMVYLLPTMPAAQTEILRVSVGGSTMRTAHVYASTAGIRVEARDSEGDVIQFFLYTGPNGIAAFHSRWNKLVIFVSNEGGGDVRLTAGWQDVTEIGGRSTVSTIFTGSLGYVTAVTGSWGAATEGMALGHLGVMAVAGAGATPGSVYYDGADSGYLSESALNRIVRLAAEESLPLTWEDGDGTAATAQMGPQRPATMVNLLQECADADGGILMERQDRLGLHYRDRTSLYNQAPALVLDYAARQLAPPLEPVDDDKWTRNDITVTRTAGSSGRVVIEEGPLSVLPPEEGGVGTYDDSVTLNLYTDEQPIQVAGWLAHLGTWNEARYPSVKVRLHRHPELIPAVLKMRIGDTLRILNPPAFVQPGPIDLQVRKITHTPRPRAWEVVFECLPAGPWNVAVVGVSKADTAGSVLAGPVDADDTVMTVATTRGPRWVDAATGWDFPFDVRVGGEVVRVDQITGPVQDAFARTLTPGWGTATSGQTWTTTGGSSADYSVQGA